MIMTITPTPEQKARAERKARRARRLKRLQRLLMAAAALRVRNWTDEEQETYTTTVKVTSAVEVGVIDNYLCFWTSGREVRVGPLTPDQAEKLCEDLGYEAIE